MKPKQYYRELLLAIGAAKDWAGSLEPADAATYREFCDDLRKEVLKRRRRCKK